MIHPIKAIEKWALKRLLNRALEGLSIAKVDISEYWNAHEEEIYTKIGKSIKNTVVDIFSKAFSKSDNISKN